MAALILGLILVIGIHSLKIAAPAWRAGLVARLGEGAYRGVYSLVSGLGLVLIVWGFALAWENPVFLYTPPSWGRHLAMGLMVLALILVFASLFPAVWIRRIVAHPLLAATMLWALAHLFANGDLAGVVLFAAFLAWAAVDFFFQPPAATGAKNGNAFGMWDIAAIVAGIALYSALLAGLHFWLFGVSPIA